MKYHYEYYWRCVDLCNGGARTATYRDIFSARISKPYRGIWKLVKFRVYDN